jgi:hypothetical protein
MDMDMDMDMAMRDSQKDNPSFQQEAANMLALQDRLQTIISDS